MTVTEHYRELAPEIQANALVGLYLSHFATLEHSLNGVIARALKLKPEQEVIILSNMDFSSKVYAARTLVSVNEDGLGSTGVARWNKTLKDLVDASTDRNTLAHTAFLPHEESRGVEFFIQRAKGKLHAPRQVWAIEDFDAKVMHLVQLAADLNVLKIELARPDLVISLQRNTEAWSKLTKLFLPPTASEVLGL